MSKPKRPRTSNPMQKLKAERVELLLARLPGWQATADRTAIARELDLGTPRKAAVLAGRICLLSACRRSEPWVSVARTRIAVRLTTPAVGGLTQADLQFALRLEQLFLEGKKRGEAAG
jgi:pterin-4a-carbinolamine dehydratase